MGYEIAFASELLTVASAGVAVSFTRTVYEKNTGLPCRKAVLSVNPGPPVNITVDGTTVTTGTGHRLAAFSIYPVEGYDNILNFRTTSASSGTAGSIFVTYYR
jgi:hypothetical protein